MAIQTGVNKFVAFAKEASWNVQSTLAGTYLRRVTSDLDIDKDKYESAELRRDYQVADVRHGQRKVGGGVKGELSPGAYSPFIGSAFRKDFTALAADTNLAVTIAGTWPNQTITSAAGRLAKGWKAGMVMRITAQTGGPAGNLNKNLFLKNVTDTVFSVESWPDALDTTTNGGTATAVTLTAPGKYSRVPETGHTNDSYSVEHYFADLVKSEVFTGNRVATFDLGLPAEGMATFDVAFMGGNMATYGAQQYSSAAAAGTAGLDTGVSGVIYVGGNKVATIQSMTIKYDGGMTTGKVVGSVITPDVFVGRVRISGQIVAYFDSVTLRDYFISESKFEVLGVLYSDNTATSDFVAFAMYACKALSAKKSDGEQGLTLTIDYQALFNSAPATDTTDDTLRTTIMVHDSQAA